MQIDLQGGGWLYMRDEGILGSLTPRLVTLRPGVLCGVNMCRVMFCRCPSHNSVGLPMRYVCVCVCVCVHLCCSRAVPVCLCEFVCVNACLLVGMRAFVCQCEGVWDGTLAS